MGPTASLASDFIALRPIAPGSAGRWLAAPRAIATGRGAGGFVAPGLVAPGGSGRWLAAPRAPSAVRGTRRPVAVPRGAALVGPGALGSVLLLEPIARIPVSAARPP